VEEDAVSKVERFEEFLRRLSAAPPAKTFEEAYIQLFNILNEVEDEMTSVPYDPENWQSDGRLYPPLRDSIRSVPAHPSVKRFRSRGHNTFIGDNGSIEIQVVSSKVTVFSKSGDDGRKVWEL
jgi:hypothetical protein